MKRTIISLFSIVLLFNACNQKGDKQEANIEVKKDTTVSNEPDFADGARAANRLFPNKLRDLPNEITAAHYPNPCYATYEDSMYIWKHNTTIQAKEDLQIVEYGSFIYTDKGWYLRVTMTAADFEASYNCKGGLLKKGIIYTDNASWRRDKQLRGGDAMWYYIAKDKNGRLVKGTAPIETEGKLIDSTVKAVSILNSTISWTGYGEIGNYSLTGSIKLKNANISTSSDSLKTASVVFDMTTITHDEKTLEEHLKGEDFFEVSKYATAAFETRKIIYTNDSTATATGILTIKGISKTVSIALKINKGKNQQAIKGKTSIDRTVFGIKYNSKSFFGNLGDKAIKNNFDLAFEIMVSR
jgi:polyisoprenoid-binding protein YceI